jgi:hypothetical protein
MSDKITLHLVKGFISSNKKRSGHFKLKRAGPGEKESFFRVVIS